MKWVVKTSTVRVSDKTGERVYRSLEDAPPEVRERIRRTLEGPNSQTILIANQEAYDRIASRQDDAPESFEKLRRLLRGSARAEQSAAPQQATRWKPLLAAGLGLIGLLWALWIWAIRSGMS